MTLLRRPAPRFFIWTAVLVAVAAVAGLAGLPPWMIAVVEFATWVLVAACERRISGPWTAGAEHVAMPQRAQAEPALQPPPKSTPARPPSAPARTPESPAEPAAERLAPPPPPARPEPPPPPPALPVPARSPVAEATETSTRWNVWSLEQLVEERAPENEELAFLIVYLRDFADTDGLLPVGFDSLVRESFGELLPRSE